MRAVVVAGATLLLLAVLALTYVRLTGLSARPEPGAMEARIAGAVRSLAILGAVRQRQNPEPVSAENIAEGLAHFADHCAVCHGTDGSGETAIGRGLFPRPPDLRAEATQRLTDGELFYVIENGVRFTGMPAFATGTTEGEAASWRLVHLVRQLPRLTDEQRDAIAELTPRSPQQIRQEIEEDAFLNGEQR